MKRKFMPIVSVSQLSIKDKDGKFIHLGVAKDVKITMTKGFLRRLRKFQRAVRYDLSKALAGSFFVPPEFIENMERDFAVAAARKTDKLLRQWTVPSPSVGKKALSPSMLLELKQALEAARNGTMPVWLGPLYKDAIHGRALAMKQRRQYRQTPVERASACARAALMAQRQGIAALIESGAWADSFRARLSGKWIAPDKSIGRKGRHQVQGSKKANQGSKAAHVRVPARRLTTAAALRRVAPWYAGWDPDSSA